MGNKKNFALSGPSKRASNKPDQRWEFLKENDLSFLRCPNAFPVFEGHGERIVEIVAEEFGFSLQSAKRSFADILQSRQGNGFAILAGVDSAEVCAFVNSVELSGQGAKRE
jgi:hypothetical protein